MTTETLIATTTAAQRVSRQEFANADISLFERSSGGFHVSIRKRDGSPAEEWYLTSQEASRLSDSLK